MIEQVSIDKIKPSPYQPRLTFDLEDIKGSVQKDGILVALTVRKKDGFYELIDGERRFRLAKELGFKNVKCDVIDVDDATARRMVWKVNTLRKDYTPKEKAYYFKRRQEEGLSLNAIALDCDERWSTVQAALNALRLTEITGSNKYETLLWEGKLSLRHLEALGDLFNSSPAGERITTWLEQILEQKLTSDELQRARKPELESIERKRVESAKKAVGKITPEVKEPKTPDELEKGAEALKRLAKKKRESNLTLEEKAKREAEKQRKKEEQKLKKEEERKQLEEKIRKEVVKRDREEVKQELLKDKNFQQRIIEQIRKPQIVKVDSCVSGVCDLPSKVESGPPLDVRAESIAQFFQNNLQCQCKRCVQFQKCGVIY